MPDEMNVILTRIEGKIEAHAAQLDAHCAEQDAWQTDMGKAVRRIDENLRGNGKPGINMRLDRIEQREKGRARLMWVAVTAAVAGFVASIRTWLAR